MVKPHVLVSYSHKDQRALTQLQKFLQPLERDGRITCWDDTHILAGDDWAQEIADALDHMTVAVLLISQDFLNSTFIYE